MIALMLNETLSKYEQDIREILMAFFPGETFCYDKKPEAGLFVCAEDHEITLLAPDKRKEQDGRETEADGMVRGQEEARALLSGEAHGGALTAALSLTEDRRENKTRIKRALYGLLSERSGKKLPWGTLTGIRPVKLADKLLSEGRTDGEASAILREQYLISPEKTAMMLEIAHREREALSRIDYRMGMSLYIGIPFCPTTCLYCSFTSYPIAAWAGRVDEYLGCLRQELRQLRAAQEGRLSENGDADGSSILYQRPIQTIYIGGGTPTSLSAEALKRLLEMIFAELSLENCAEFTVEAGRPDSITKEKLRVLRAFGADRISINPQTMNQKTLDLIGRRHTAEDVRRAFCEAREAGFDNINMDLIMGLPGEHVSDVRHTLSEIELMRPDSLTVHALAVKRAARLNTSGCAWANLWRAGEEEASEMTALGAETAEALGLKPYYLYRQKNMAGNQENTGYALPGKENLYNILMMEEQHTVIGCGAGSTSKAVIENRDSGAFGGNRFRVERCENMKNIAEYLPRFSEVLAKKRDFLLQE